MPNKPKPITRPPRVQLKDPTKTAEHIKPKPSYKKEKVPIKKPKQPALSGFLGGIIPKKPNKPTPSKKKPLSKTNRSAKKSMPKRRAM